MSFTAGEQRAFLSLARDRLGKNWGEIANMISVNPRTLRDWVREKYNMSQPVAYRISRLCKIKIPPTACTIVWHEHLRQAGCVGQAKLQKKYAVKSIRELVDENHRQEQWREWWKKTGQYQKNLITNNPKSFKKPLFSAKLAEFIGIVLGDGGISKYQITITHHSVDDHLHGKYIQGLIEDLFLLKPGVRKVRGAQAVNIYISRVDLVRYFTNTLGLKVGNKVNNQVDIPDWIKDRLAYYKACVRGLIDTDGSVFIHRYRVNGKVYSYKKLEFCSHSEPLRRSVCSLLKEIGLHPRLTRGFGVRLDSKQDMQEYFHVIGTHNPKHLKRYLQ